MKKIAFVFCLSSMLCCQAKTFSFAERSDFSQGIPVGWTADNTSSNKTKPYLSATQPDSSMGAMRIIFNQAYANNVLNLICTEAIDDDAICDNFVMSVEVYIQPRNGATSIDSIQPIISVDGSEFVPFMDAVPFKSDVVSTAGWYTYNFPTNIQGAASKQIKVGLRAIAGGYSYESGYIREVRTGFKVCATIKSFELLEGGEVVDPATLVPNMENLKARVKIDLSPDDVSKVQIVEGQVRAMAVGNVTAGPWSLTKNEDGYWYSDSLPYIDAGAAGNIGVLVGYTSPSGAETLDGTNDLGVAETSSFVDFSVGKLGSVWINEISANAVEFCGTTNRQYVAGWKLSISNHTGNVAPNIVDITSLDFNHAFSETIGQTKVVGFGCFEGIDFAALQYPLTVRLINPSGIEEDAVSLSECPNPSFGRVNTALWSEDQQYSYDWTGTASSSVFVWSACSIATMGAANYGQGFKVETEKNIKVYSRIGADGEEGETTPLPYASIVVSVDEFSNSAEAETASTNKVADANGVAEFNLHGWTTNRLNLVAQVKADAFGWRSEDVNICIPINDETNDFAVAMYPAVAFDGFQSELSSIWVNAGKMVDTSGRDLSWFIKTDRTLGSYLCLNTLSAYTPSGDTKELCCSNFLYPNGKASINISLDTKNKGTYYADGRKDELTFIFGTNSTWQGETIETIPITDKNTAFSDDTWYNWSSQIVLPSEFSSASGLWLKLKGVSEGTTSSELALRNLRIAFEDMVEVTGLERAAEWPVSGEGAAFTLTLLPHTQDEIADVSADLYAIVNGVTNVVPFAFADGSVTNSLGLVDVESVVGEEVVVTKTAVATNMTISADFLASELKRQYGRGLMMGDKVTYFAAVRYNSDNGAVEVADRYETRYYPDNSTTTEVDGTEFWVVEGAYGTASDLSAYTFTVPGEIGAISGVGEPEVGTTNTVVGLEAYAAAGLSTLSVNVSDGAGYSEDFAPLGASLSGTRASGALEITDGLSPNTEYTITVTATDANGANVPSTEFTIVTLPVVTGLEIEPVSTTAIQLTVNGAADSYTVEPSGWVAGDGVWTRTVGTANSLYEDIEVSVTPRNKNGATNDTASAVATGYTLAAVAGVAPAIAVADSTKIVVGASEGYSEATDGNPEGTEYAVRVTTSAGGDALLATDGQGAVVAEGGEVVWRTPAEWRSSPLTVESPVIDLTAENTFRFVTRNFDGVETDSATAETASHTFDMEAGFKDGVEPVQKAEPFGEVGFTLTFFDPAQSASARAYVEYKIGNGAWTALEDFAVDFTGGLSAEAVCTWDAWSAVNEANGTYSYSLHVKLVDGAVTGRESKWSKPVSGTLDFTKPAGLAFTAKPAAYAATPAFTFTASATDAADLTYHWTLNGDEQSGTGATFSGTAVANQANTVTVYARDAYGNESAPIDHTWTVDTINPTQPVFTAQPAALTNARGYAFTASSTDTNLSRYHWTLGGVAQSEEGATFSGSLPSNAEDGDYTVTVTAEDAAGNVSEVAEYTWELDTTAPAGLAVSGTPVHGAVTSDATVGLTASATDKNDITYRWDFNGAESAGATLTATSEKQNDNTASVWATDAAGNVSGPVTVTWTLDTIIPDAPAIAGTPANGAKVNGGAYSFAASNPGDTGTALTYSWQLKKDSDVIGNYAGDAFAGTVAEDGTYTVSVSATDAAGNAGPASTTTWEYDATKPTVALATELPENVPFNETKTFAVTATFSEPVTGFEAADVAVANGSVTGFSGEGTSYTFTVAPTGDGAVTVSVNAEAAVDDAGNTSEASAPLTRTYDNTKPGVTLATTLSDDAPFNETKTFAVTATFIEAVTGFAASDVTVVNGSVTGFSGSGTSYSFTVVPGKDGDVKVSVAAGVAQDAAENGNTASNTVTREYDNTKPGVTLATTLSGDAPFNSTKTFAVTATFTESVTGFEASDVTVVNGSVTGFSGSGTSYSFTVVPSKDGDVTVSVAAGVAQDAAENGSTASNTVTRKYDNTKPGVTLATTLSDDAPFNSTKTFAVTATFTEAVTGFAAADVTVVNGSVTGFSGSGANYLFTVAPTGDGEVKVSVAADKAVDAAENGNTASNELTRKYDNTKPTVTLRADQTPNPFNESDTFVVTAEFTEDVTGLGAGGIAVANGTVASVTGSGKLWTIMVTPTAEDEVSVSVNADAAFDAAGNGNEASAALTRRYDATAPTVGLKTETPNPFNADETFTVLVTFSEAVTGFTAEDVTIDNGVVDTFTASEEADEAGKVWTVVVTPQAPTEEEESKVFDITVSVGAEVAQDAARNDNTASNELVLTYDIEAPTVELESETPNLFNPADSYVVTATFSEDVEDFDESKVNVVNGSVASVQAVSASVYNITITPTADGDVTVTLAAEAASDAAGNKSEAAPEGVTRTYDGTKPWVSAAYCNTPSSFNAETEHKISVLFSESVTDFGNDSVTVGNGTFTWTGSGNDYEVTITPIKDGPVTFQIDADKVHDAAGNGNVASSTVSRTYDNTKPTVELTTGLTDGVPFNTSPFTVTATFTEPVTGFDASDVVVVNCTVAVSGTGATYTLTVTPTTTDGDVTVSVAAEAAVDAAGNKSEESDSLTRHYDIEPPTVALATTLSDDAPFNSTKTFAVTATFSEAVTGFEAGDVTVVNGSVTGFSGSGTGYSFTVEPGKDGDVKVSVAAGKAADAAGNGNTASNELKRRYDNTKPQVTLATELPENVPFNSTKTFAVTATFTESVTGFDAADVEVVNGSVTGFSGSGTSYSFTVVPTGDDDVTVSVKAEAAVDVAGNTSEASEPLTRRYDNTKPQVELATELPENVPFNSTKTFAVTATFREPVTGFEAAGVTVVNGEVTDFSGEGTEYTFTVTPTDDGAVTVSVNADAAVDAAGNTSEASDALMRTYDKTKPQVELTTTLAENVPFNATKTFAVTAKFNETVTDFDGDDVSVVNGSVTDFSGFGDEYTFTIVPDHDGDVTVQIAADVASDVAENGNEQSNELTRKYDNTMPGVTLATTLSGDAPFNSTKTFAVTATFAEPVTGFDAGDVTVVNGSVTDFSGSGTSYSFTVVPSKDGDVTVSVAAGVAQDAAENGSTVAEPLTRKYDNTKPGVTLATTLSGDAPFNSTKTFAVTATFTEAVTGFAAAGVTVVNGEVMDFSGSGTGYSFTVAPTGDGDVKVSVAAGKAADAAGNGNTASNELVRQYDNTKPTVTLRADQTPNPFNASDTFVVTAEFTEDVTGLGAGGIAVANGTVASVAGSGKVWTIMVTPTAEDEVTVSVKADAAFDSAGNGNEASAALTRRYDATAPTVGLKTKTPDPFNAEETFTVRVEFSEAVTGFTAEDVAIENGVVDTFTASEDPEEAGKVWTVVVTPQAPTEEAKVFDITVSVATGVAQDAARNDNTASSELVLTYDIEAPTVELESEAGAKFNTETFTVRVMFSEEVAAFGTGNITVENGAAESVVAVDGEDNVYDVTVRPTDEGIVTVTLAAGAVEDIAGNGNTAAVELTREYDVTPPEATLTSESLEPFNAAAAPWVVKVEFSEEIAGFTAANVTASANCTIGNVQQVANTEKPTYTFDVTPNAGVTDADLTVQILADEVTDLAGNDNDKPSNELTRRYDAVRPTVTLESTTRDTFNGKTETFVVTATFSEPVTGLEANDVTVVNGSVAVSGEGTVWTLTVTPAAEGPVRVTITENGAYDAAGNGNAMSETLTKICDWTKPTVTLTCEAVANGGTTSVRMVTLVASAEENSTYVYIWRYKVGSVWMYPSENGATFTMQSIEGANEVRVCAQDAANNQGDEVKWTWTYEPPSAVVFEGGVSVAVDAETGETNSVDFVTLDFTPGAASEFALSGFDCEGGEGEVTGLKLWFVVSESLLGETRLVPAAETGRYADGKLYVTLPGGATQDGEGHPYRSFFILGISNEGPAEQD